MAQLFDIKKVVVGPKNLEATVELAANAPLMTSEDLEGTTRVCRSCPNFATTCAWAMSPASLAM